jgi:hypothetical protein
MDSISMPFGKICPQKLRCISIQLPNDCVSSHVPKCRTEDVIYAIMTDHLIQRYSSPSKELLAERQETPDIPANAYRGPVKRYPYDHQIESPRDALYEATAQVIDSSNLEAGPLRWQI